MKLRRALAALSVVATVGVVPLVAASPASATAPDCRAYLARVGYNVGPKVTEACEYGAFRSPVGTGKIPNPNCLTRLRTIGVTGDHSLTACKRA